MLESGLKGLEELEGLEGLNGNEELAELEELKGFEQLNGLEKDTDLIDKEVLQRQNVTFEDEENTKSSVQVWTNLSLHPTSFIWHDIHFCGLFLHVIHNPLSADHQRGEKKREPFRVVGGKLAYENEIPWQVTNINITTIMVTDQYHQQHNEHHDHDHQENQQQHQ